MIYFTSDLHFFHNKEFVYGPRGFSTVEEMNDAILKRYNEIVTPEDTVYILGDCMLMDNEKGIDYLKQLNGHKYLVIGNHDTDTRIQLYKDNHIFEDIQYGYRLNFKHVCYLLSHYPMLVGNFEDDKPIINLYAHTHQKDNFLEGNYHNYHVGVDSHDCYPVSITEIILDIKHQKNGTTAIGEPCDTCENRTDCPWIQQGEYADICTKYPLMKWKGASL